MFPNIPRTWRGDNSFRRGIPARIREEPATYCGLLPGQSSKRFSWRLYFVNAYILSMPMYILSMPIFCWHLCFVDAYILLTPIFCRCLCIFCQCLYFFDAYILSTPIFCWRLYFVDAYILSTPIFCRRLYFVCAYIFISAYIFFLISFNLFHASLLLCLVLMTSCLIMLCICEFFWIRVHFLNQNQTFCRTVTLSPYLNTVHQAEMDGDMSIYYQVVVSTIN